MQSFTVRAVEIIKSIPRGKVMTYGQVAQMAGSHRASRQVVRILHSMSKKYDLPWHRVINAKGEISFTEDEPFTAQKLLLQGEEVEFINFRGVNLEKHQFRPESSHKGHS